MEKGFFDSRAYTHLLVKYFRPKPLSKTEGGWPLVPADVSRATLVTSLFVYKYRLFSTCVLNMRFK